MNGIKTLVILFALFFVFAPKTMAAQQWIVLHHEAQGPNDPKPTYHKCMPDDNWSAHDGHIGDYSSLPDSWDSKEECQAANDVQMPEFGALTGALALLSSGGTMMFLRKKK